MVYDVMNGTHEFSEGKKLLLICMIVDNYVIPHFNLSIRFQLSLSSKNAESYFKIHSNEALVFNR